jgi:hypothetical protein
MAFNQQLSVLGQVAPATTGTAGQVLVSAGSSASSYWASAIPVSAYSAQFSGSNYLSIPTNAAFGLGTGDFTIECWVYPTSNPANGVGNIFDFRTGTTASALVGRITSSLQLMFYDGPGNVETAFTTRSITLNTWQHIAYVRSGNTVYGYINGLLAGSVGVTSNLGSSQPFYIGANQTAGYNFNGYISNFRVVKGVAVYTGVFTPPTSPLGTSQAAGTNIAAVSTSQTSLLTCNSPGFTDSSSNAFTITIVSSVITSQFAPFSSFSAIARSAAQTQTILTSGSGTYYTPSGVAWLRIRMVGGGGGGAGGGGSGTDGSVGASTTFGASFLVAGGGSNGVKNNGPGGAGGTSSIASGATGASISGGSGEGGGYGVYAKGGDGGSSAFGGSGLGGRHAAAINSGTAGATNSGAGGGGGNINNASNDSAGSGGGAGGYVEAYISSPAAYYAYSVGAAGAGGAGAGQGAAGGGGGSGIIIVEENYAVSVTASNYTISYLIVAGGGGGGGGATGGGGGAGGLLSGNTPMVLGTTYTVTVGSGGAGGTAGNAGVIGNNSSLTGITAAVGGGRGGSGTNGASSGGSGGGGTYSAGATAGGAGTSGQGNNGGSGANFTVGSGAGGGGGASAVGGNSGSNDPGPSGSGGAGTASSITGSSVTYAGGGGGGAGGTGDTAGSGGAGGGGNGNNNGNGTAGTTNTGGGGGGAGANSVTYTGGAGGSGVVILSIPNFNYSGITTGSPTVTTVGNNKVLTFTQSGSYTA